MSQAALLVKLGRKIRVIRIRKNMSQNELAMECDFEKASMSRIESGQSNLTIRTLFKIAKALDVEMAELFSD